MNATPTTGSPIGEAPELGSSAEERALEEWLDENGPAPESDVRRWQDNEGDSYDVVFHE